MGKLSGLHESLSMIAMPVIAPIAEEPQPDLLLDALNALVSAVSGITIPEVKIDLNTAVGKLVKALSGIQFPEHKIADLSPVVEAIRAIKLEVEFPEAPEVEATPPCCYTFTIVRDESGIMSSVVAMPGVAEATLIESSYVME